MDRGGASESGATFDDFAESLPSSTSHDEAEVARRAQGAFVAVAATAVAESTFEHGDDVDGVTMLGRIPGSEVPSFGAPLSLQPRGGYLYVRLLEAGNLNAVRQGCDLLSASCKGLAHCGSRPPTQFLVALSCASLERTTVSTSVLVDTKLHCVTFCEEFLMRILNFCSADKLTIQLRAGSTVVGEAALPLRVALPPLGRGCPQGAVLEESPLHALPASDWLPVQRVRFHSRPRAKVASSLPYIDLQLLLLVDSSLPRLIDTTPLLLAIEGRQETLVRAYLALDVAESMPMVEQARCVTVAIEQRYSEVLSLLMDRIRPLHQHLLLSIRLHATDLVDVLLQTSGASLLHPDCVLLDGHLSSTRKSQPRGERLLTPLSLACSLGFADIVEVMCRWAQREKVHVDPSAPLVLHQEFLVAGVRNAESSGSSVAWWDQDERLYGSDAPCRSDPPMVMAVRGCSCTAFKLQIVVTLARFGFSPDTRSPVDSWTALLAAVELGSLELVQVLLKRGARHSADRQLGYTPLHLACQMAHWHLVPILTESMCGQYSRVAAWGPSPQYVSLDLVDSYSRTALDIVLLKYFACSLPTLLANAGTTRLPQSSEGQKHVDILREFLRASEPESTGIVCGQELLRVLRFLDTLPSEGVGALIFGDHLASGPDSPHKSGGLMTCALLERPQPPAVQYGDMEEVLQVIRVLVRAGAKTRCFLDDLLQPHLRGKSGCSSSKYSALDMDDLLDISLCDAPPLRSDT